MHKNNVLFVLYIYDAYYISAEAPLSDTSDIHVEEKRFIVRIYP